MRWQILRCRKAVKVCRPRRQEEILGQILGSDTTRSVRQSCRVLGFRRQTYYQRKGGHRPEEADMALADLLHQVTQRFVAWGFWKVFHYLREYGPQRESQTGISDLEAGETPFTPASQANSYPSKVPTATLSRKAQ